MRLLQDGVVAALAAIGLTAVIFLLVSAIVHPRHGGHRDMRRGKDARIHGARAAEVAL